MKIRNIVASLALSFLVAVGGGIACKGASAPGFNEGNFQLNQGDTWKLGNANYYYCSRDSTTNRIKLVNQSEYQITCFLNRYDVRDSAYSNSVPAYLRSALSQYYLPGDWIHNSSWDWLRNKVPISDTWFGYNEHRGHFILTNDNGHCTTDVDGDDADWMVKTWNWCREYDGSLSHSSNVSVASDDGSSIVEQDYYTDQSNTYAMFFTELDGSSLLLQKPVP